MTSTVNPWPTPAGEQHTKVDVARFVRGWTTHAAQVKSRTGAKRTAAIYQLSDRLHDGRTVRLTAEEIVTTVSAWLAELGASSPLAEDLAQAVRVGDWPKAHSLGEYLSVDVTMVLCPIARRIGHRAEIR